MRNKIFRMNANAALLGLIAAAYPVVGYTAPAARVDFAVGNVQAVGPNGQSRNLAKGAQLEQGETIATNNGRAQLRFTDGAFVSLQPESEFRIDQYRFDGKQDGNEKGFFSLVKGGLRTITGLVGRNNKNNYQINTSVATIGIRGTEYTIQYGQSITGSVGEGEIQVCNGAGCLSVTNGESYYVQNQEIKPVLTNKRTDLPPPSPQNPPSTFAQGDTVDESGQPCSIGGACGELLTGSGPFNVGIANQSSAYVVMESESTVSNGELQEFDSFGSLVALAGPYAGVKGDSIIAWGTAASCSGGECSGIAHYVVGKPFTASDLSTMGATPMTGTYSMMPGPTAITNSSGNTVGTLTRADMTVNFFSSSFNGNMEMAMTFNGASVNPSMSISGSVCSGMQSFSFFSCGGSGSVSVFGSGFFAGTKAERAGFVYHVDDGQVSGAGAGAMRQDSLKPANIPQ